ncbi:hypothetical protein [Halorussus amylolyticus]|uniref:hypothetical protein n=1 Tax=Halorussus amylolyticus TaxID=1126242 RepID=UPI001EE43696|nr:hypothetical protein [Halorussus amylolyticus]
MSAGAAAAALGTVGSVNAKDKAESLPLEAINNKFHNAVKDDGAAGAKDGFEGFGLNPIVQKSQDFKVNEIPDDDSDVTPQYSYKDPKESNSELITSLSTYDGDVVLGVSMILRGCATTFRNSWFVDDAIGIGFNDSDWADVGEPAVTASTDHTARFTQSDVASNALAGTVDIVNQDGGVATCDAIPKATVSLTGQFRLRDGGEPTTLWGSYSHTFGYEPTGTIQSIEGGRGGISLNLKLGASTYWSIADPSDPEDVL